MSVVLQRRIFLNVLRIDRYVVSNLALKKNVQQSWEWKKLYKYIPFQCIISLISTNFWMASIITSNFLITNHQWCRGATGAVYAPKPGKAPIMAVRRRLLFFKIEVRPQPCRPYRVRRHCRFYESDYIRPILFVPTSWHNEKLCNIELILKKTGYRLVDIP